MKKLLPPCFLECERELHRYEALRKAQLDYNTDIKVAGKQGEKLAEIRSIQRLERILKRTETPSEQLATLPLDDLTSVANCLEEQVLRRQ